MERFNRLSHSIWDSKYHIVWIPEYGWKELYGERTDCSRDDQSMGTNQRDRDHRRSCDCQITTAKRAVGT